MTDQVDRAEVFDKPLTYEEATDDGVRVVYRGSGLGSCVGALVRSRLGVTASTPPDFMLGKFQEGIDWEQRVIEMAAKVGKYTIARGELLEQYAARGVVDGQLEVEIPCGKDAVVKLHPDAIFISKNTLKPYVVEVKFLSEGFAKTKTEEDLGTLYEWQFAAEMIGTGLPGLYVIARKVMGDVGTEDEGKVVGISDDLTFIIRNQPKMSAMDIKSRVWEVEGYVARGEMPNCPVPLMYPCGYWAEHEKAPVVYETDELLTEMLRQYRFQESVKSEHEQAMKDLRGQIEDRMIDLHVEEAKVEGIASVARTAPRPGNVSWKGAWDVLKKAAPEAAKMVDLEKLRGKEVAAGIKITVEKNEGGKSNGS